MTTYQTSSDSFAWSVADITLLLFASCTLAYEFVLITRLPTWSWYPLVIVALILAIAFQVRYGESRWKNIRNIRFDASTWCLIGLGIACGLINVFTLRPDADDYSYFHRAVFGLLDLSSPIPLHHTGHDIPSLPAISPVFLTSSLEVVEALVAHALGIQPLFFYHQIVGFIALFIFPLIYFLFFRYLKFSQWACLLGTAIVIFLYASSGDSHRDWGNFTVVRAWQGKCILIMLLVPLTALLTFQFLQTGSTADLLRLHFAAISGIGLTGTAFFLIPFIIGISVVGAIPYHYKQPFFLRRTLLLGTTLLFFAVLFVIIKAGGLPEVSNTTVWQLPVDNSRRPELVVLENTLFVKKTTLWFYFVALIGIIWLFRLNSRITSLAISSLCVCVALVLPPISNLLIKITLAGAYWRLAYASQMLLIIGLFVLLCLYGKKRIYQIPFGICFLISFALLKMPAVNSNVIHSPQALKFPSQDIAFAQVLALHTPFRAVTAIPEKLVPSVGLLRPDIQLISTRALETRHVFVNAGDENEGKLRNEAQLDLDYCGSNGKLKRFMSKKPTLTALVFPLKCASSEIINNLSIHESDWQITRSDHYQLWNKSSPKFDVQ